MGRPMFPSPIKPTIGCTGFPYCIGCGVRILTPALDVRWSRASRAFVVLVVAKPQGRPAPGSLSSCTIRFTEGWLPTVPERWPLRPWASGWCSDRRRTTPRPDPSPRVCRPWFPRTNGQRAARSIAASGSRATRPPNPRVERRLARGARGAQSVEPRWRGTRRDALELEGAQLAALLVADPVLVGPDVPVGHGGLVLPGCTARRCRSPGFCSFWPGPA